MKKMRTTYLFSSLALAALALLPFAANAWTAGAVETLNDVGKYSDIAVNPNNGYVHICYYDATNKDLKYAYFNTGVAGAHWTISTADNSANDVGQYCSVALDGSGNAYVSYYDATAKDLKYGYYYTKGGIWMISTFRATADDEGKYSSIAYDPVTGDRLISYYNATKGDLMFTKYTGAPPIYTKTVDASVNDVGKYSSIAVDANGVRHVMYYDDTANDLKRAVYKAGAWTTEVVDNGGTANNDVGQYASVAVDEATGDVHASYINNTTGDIKHAWHNGSIWTKQPVILGSSGGVVKDTAIAVDASGLWHIAYTGLGKLYEIIEAPGTGWNSTIVDTTGGLEPSLTIDGSGVTHMSYYKSTDLFYAAGP